MVKIVYMSLELEELSNGERALLRFDLVVGTE